MRKCSSLLITVSTFSLTCGTAIAQDRQGSDDAEIVVTAQKRAEVISDVPLTLSARTGEQLQSIGVDEFDELAAYIPGLTVQEQSPNNPGFVIRGITSDSGSAQIAPRVTIYYNGIDVSRSRGSYFELHDIDRVEVVKGPQATLFGTASTIGAISVITNKPEPGFSGEVSASYGNFDYVEATGFLNAGNEKIAGRIAASYKKRDGYVRNIAGEPGTTSATTVGIDQDDLAGVDQLALRGSVRIWPSDSSTMDFVFSYEQQRNTGAAFKSGSLPPTGGNTSPFSFAELGGSPLSLAALGKSELGIDREVYDANVTFNTEIDDNWSLTTVAGYRKFDSLEVFDADGSPLWYLEFAEDAEGEQISFETRFDYESDLIRGFIGANIFYEQGTQRVPFSSEEGTFFACLPLGLLPEPLNSGIAQLQGLLSQAQGGVDSCVTPGGVYTAPNATAILTQGAASAIPYTSEYTNGGKNSVYSVFADVTVSPIEQLELTAGVRYLYEERKSTYSSIQPDSFLFNLLGQQAGLGGLSLPLIPTFVNTNGFTFSAKDDFDAWLPRFNLRYEFAPDASIYATVSKGRRSPVLDIDGPPATNFTLVEEETVWNYEGGIKAGMGGFNGSLGIFYQEYENFQTSLFDNTGRVVPVNAGQAEAWGIEAEASYTFMPGVRLFANYAYIDAKISEPPAGGATTFVGSRFRLTPEHSASAGLDIDLPVSDSFSIYFTPTVTYQSEIFFEIPNTAALSQDGYTLVNARGGIRFGDRYELGGFVRNAFDEEYLIDAGNTGGTFGTATFIRGEPALYGVEVTARF